MRGWRLQGIVLSAEVAAALREGRAVVALESTIIAHGMPWPQNLDTARAVEAAVRARGAVPATVAVLGGVPRVGLTDEQLQALASRWGLLLARPLAAQRAADARMPGCPLLRQGPAPAPGLCRCRRRPWHSGCAACVSGCTDLLGMGLPAGATDRVSCF